jgi:hypothetical protein
VPRTELARTVDDDPVADGVRLPRFLWGPGSHRPHPVRAQRANAIAEHWIGSLLRECLDHLLIIGPRHLAAVLQEAPGSGPRSSGAV